MKLIIPLVEDKRDDILSKLIITDYKSLPITNYKNIMTMVFTQG